MDRILLDTNALLDVAIEHRPEADRAQQLFDLVADGKILAYIFPGSLKDFFYITRRDLDEETRRAWISLFLDTFLLTGFDRKICTTALSSDEPDFEDGLVRAAAEQEGCTCIITGDVEAFAASPLVALTPREYLGKQDRS